MGNFKVATVDGRLNLVPDEEALALLRTHDGASISIDLDAEGRLVLSSGSRSPEERRERGRAFLNRYRSTFEQLAK